MFLIFGVLITFVFLDVKKADNVDLLNDDVEINLTEKKSELDNLNDEKIDVVEDISNDDACSVDNSGNDSIGCSVDIGNSKSEIEKEVVKKKDPSEIVGTKKEYLAYDFELVNLSGEKVKLSDYRGQKPVIVEFWNAWCHNCQREMPKLQKTYEKYDGKFEIIGVNLLENKDFSGNEDSKEEVVSFVKKYGITFPIVFDDNLLAARKYKVKATNHHFLINKDGTIYDSFFIDLEEEILGEFLKFNEIK